MTRDFFLAVMRSSLFAAAGAGAGFSLAISVWLGLAVAFSGDILVFDCSTLEHCGLSAINNLIGLLFWLFGSAVLAVIGALWGYLFALPAVALSGAALARATLNSHWLYSRWVWIGAGALSGAIWWSALWWLQILPDIFLYDSDIAQIAPYSPPHLIAAAAVGGALSSAMFHRWWSLEHIADLGPEHGTIVADQN